MANRLPELIKYYQNKDPFPVPKHGFFVLMYFYAMILYTKGALFLTEVAASVFMIRITP